ncbi:MDR family MFS transporter [Rhodococcoides kyotonense]|uniref:Predicted arabinose efflux permease, MFS family n=1 Tax=Rhodococcoides kyotonense TaxID=398843 RepID=A0A239N0Y9_9NOCA|nr:MFS transporter [Rhodococcus kyotonensis]SNT48631.1 Predicted arabinose efflux permease, MFS family [Rhodococcus kyotonensis]
MIGRRSSKTGFLDLPARYWGLWISILVMWIGRFVIPFMTIYLTQERGLSEVQAGTFVGAFGFGLVGSTFMGGILADMFGRKKVLIASKGTAATVMVAIPLVDGYVSLAILLTLFGLANGAAQPAMNTMVVEIVPREKWHLAISYQQWAVNLGYALGPIFGGLLAQHNFSLLFWAEAAMLVGAIALIATLVKDEHTPNKPFGKKSAPTASSSGSILTVFKDRVFVGMVGINFLYAMVYIQSTTSLPVAMTAQGYSNQQFALLLTINGLMLCALQVPAARYLRKLPREGVLAVSIVVIGIGVGLQGFAQFWWMYAAAVSIWTLGEMGAAPSRQRSAAELSRPDMRGRYLGVFALSVSCATLLGPVVGGFILGKFGAQILWFCCAGVCFALALIAVSSRRQRNIRVKELADSELATPAA